MTDKISQDGNWNIAIQNISNSTINVTQQLSKSVEYQSLLEQLKTYQIFLSYIPQDASENRLKVNKKIEELESFIEVFKQDVCRLAETFNGIEIDSERLIKAKELFDNGKFNEARKILLSNVKKMKLEQEQLLSKRDEYEKKLKHNSEEFLVLAMTMAFDHNNPNKFSETCRYFESSIKSQKTKDNLFLYAQFLSFYNYFQRAKDLWEECFKGYENEMEIEQKGEILNNIALTYSYSNNFEKASSIFDNALALAREVQRLKPNKENQSNVAYILNNFGLLLTNFDKNEEADNKLTEALTIRESLVEDDSFESFNNVAVTTLNLGFTSRNKRNYKDAEEYYLKELSIYEKLKEKKLFYSLKQFALILNNLGDLNDLTDNYEMAEKYYNESAELGIELLIVEPLATVPTFIMSLANLASFYKNRKPEKEISIGFAVDAIIFGLPLINEMAEVSEQIYKARNILESWNMNEQEINKTIENRLSFLNKEQIIE